jgi:hypothetical protein
MRFLKTLPLLLLLVSLAALAADDLPRGTKITVRIKTNLNSDNMTPGDSFEAVLDRDLVVNGKTIAAEGATARGRVDTADSSNGGQTAGLLIIRLTEVETKDAIYNFTTNTYTRQGHARTGPRNRPGNLSDTIAGIGHPTNPGDIDNSGSIGRGSGPAALIPPETVVTFRTTSPSKTESKNSP